VSNEVENYLKAYDEADGMATNLKRVADSIERVVYALRAGSRIACTEALPQYPTEAELSALLSGLEQAKDRVRQLWDAVPEAMQHRLPQPDRVGRPLPDVSLLDR